MLKRYTIFNEGKPYGEHERAEKKWIDALPKTAIIHAAYASGGQSDPQWMTADLCPILESDVPKPLKAWVLICA